MGKPIRILIADDIDDDVLRLTHHLSEAGFDVEHQRVTNADALTAALDNGPWDIVLCDDRLANFSADAALAVIEDSGTEVPLVVVSDAIGEESTADLMRAGAHDFILKHNLDRLAPAIERGIRDLQDRRDSMSVTAALEMERRLLDHLMESIPDAIYFKDREHRYIRANEAETAILGATGVDQVIGRTAEDLIDKERAGMRRNEEESIFATGEPLINRTEKAIQPDGTVHWYSATKAPIRDQDGEIIGLVGITRDITRMKEAEAESRASVRRLRDAIDSLQEGFALFDADDRMVAFNALYRRFNPSAPDALEAGLTFEHLFRANVARGTITEAAGREEEFIRDRLERHRNPKGSIIRKFGDGRTYMIREARTGEGGTALSFTDITEIVQAEEALRESESRFRDLATAASDWFWETDENLRFTYLSDQYEKITGLDPKDAIGKTRTEFAGAEPDTESVWWSDHFADIAAHRPFHDFTYPMKGVDDSVRYIRSSGVPFFGDDGSFRGYRGTASDITEVKNTEWQLQQAVKMDAVGNLTGGIAHDFNNILGVVLGNLQLVNRRVKDNAPVAALIEAAINAVQRGADLTRQLLAFSRRQELEPQILDVNALVAGMEKMLRRTLGEAVVVTTTVGDDVGRVKADPTQLESSLLNLAINARDAMPEGGRLIIETSNETLDAAYVTRNPEATPGPMVCISVYDNGRGIPENVRSKIFEPFFTTKEVDKGTGLGLSMVYGFVKQSGGHINVYSEEGEGSRFRIYLPRIEGDPAQASVAAAEDQPLPRGDETILLVEDNSEFRRTAALQLEDLGYIVIAEADGPSAIRALEAGIKFDMLFTDMVMPGGINGHQLAERVCADRPGIAVLLTSGYPRDAFQGGRRFPLLSKPYNDIDLARAIRAALDGPPVRKDQ